MWCCDAQIQHFKEISVWDFLAHKPNQMSKVKRISNELRNAFRYLVTEYCLLYVLCDFNWTAWDNETDR